MLEMLPAMLLAMLLAMLAAMLPAMLPAKCLQCACNVACNVACIDACNVTRNVANAMCKNTPSSPMEGDITRDLVLIKIILYQLYNRHTRRLKNYKCRYMYIKGK